MSDADVTKTDSTETTDPTLAPASEATPVAPELSEEKKDETDVAAEPEAESAEAAPAPIEDAAPLDDASGAQAPASSDSSEATGAPSALPESSATEPAQEAPLEHGTEAAPATTEASEAAPVSEPEAAPVDAKVEDDEAKKSELSDKDATAAPIEAPTEGNTGDASEGDAPAEDLTPAHFDVTTPDAALPIQQTKDDTTVDLGDEDHGNLGAGSTPEAFSPTTVTAADSDADKGKDEPAAQEPVKGPMDEARPDSDAADKAAADSEEPNVGLQSPLDAIRSQTHKDAAPVLEEQESPVDAAIRRPLTAQVVEETKGAHDAMPEEAQRDMAKDRFTFADPNAMAGTIEDPTGVSGDVKSAQVQTAIAGGKQPTEAILDQAKGTGDDTSAADAQLTDADDGDSDEAEAGTTYGDDDVFTNEGEDAEDDSYFGDLRPQFAPMAEIVDDGLDHIRDAAESGAKAVNVLVAVPNTLLELEHRDVVERMRRIVGELMILAGELFKKN